MSEAADALWKQPDDAIGGRRAHIAAVVVHDQRDNHREPLAGRRRRKRRGWYYAAIDRRHGENGSGRGLGERLGDAIRPVPRDDGAGALDVLPLNVQLMVLPPLIRVQVSVSVGPVTPNFAIAVVGGVTATTTDAELPS